MSINQTAGSPPIISQINGNALPTVTPILIGLIVLCIVSLIIAMGVGNLRTQKKILASTIVYDSQLLSLAGEAQRQPWKDRGGSKYSDIMHFCNKISLTIKNEGSLSIDTDVSNEPLAIKLDVRGKLETIKVLEAKSTNPRLDLSAIDGKVLVEHIRIEPREFLQIVFLGYFKLDLKDLDYLNVDYSEELH